MRFLTISMICLGSVFSYGAFASPQPAFECKGAGENYEFIYAIDDERYALTGYPESEDEYLNLETASGEGALFIGKKVRFFEASQESGLSSNIQIIATDERFDCASTRVTSNIEGAVNDWVDGMALETIVREAPNVGAKQIDKLPLKEPLGILRNEGQTYQEYPWFLIEYSEGLRGYAWGGTLCSEGQMIEGVAVTCADVQ